MTSKIDIRTPKYTPNEEDSGVDIISDVLIWFQK